MREFRKNVSYIFWFHDKTLLTLLCVIIFFVFVFILTIHFNIYYSMYSIFIFLRGYLLFDCNIIVDKITYYKKLCFA